MRGSEREAMRGSAYFFPWIYEWENVAKNHILFLLFIFEFSVEKNYNKYTYNWFENKNKNLVSYSKNINFSVNLRAVLMQWYWYRITRKCRSYNAYENYRSMTLRHIIIAENIRKESTVE